MLIAFIQDFAVHLIRDNHGAAADDDLSQACELIPLPQPADGILRVAEDDGLDSAGSGPIPTLGWNLAFQVFKVHIVDARPPALAHC